MAYKFLITFTIISSLYLGMILGLTLELLQEDRDPRGWNTPSNSALQVLWGDLMLYNHSIYH